MVYKCADAITFFGTFVNPCDLPLPSHLYHLTELRQTLLDNRIIDSPHRMINLPYSERLRNYQSGVSSILVNACTSSCTNHRNPFTGEI